MDAEAFYARFPTRADCIRRLEELRWGGVPRCPYCGSIKASRVKVEPRHHCNTCLTSFSVTVNTVFHGTRLDLQKWFAAIALVIASEGRISGRALARRLRITKDTACRIKLQIVCAMHEPTQRRLFLYLTR